ncbi:hypothetical protein D3C72_1999380 [compost metagenome]
MQEWRFPPLQDIPLQPLHQAAGKAFATPVVVHADRADFGVSGRMHPFTRHRDQAAIHAHAYVVAHFMRARAERARLGLLREQKHVFRIGVAQRHDVGLVRAVGVAAGGDHLVDYAYRLSAQ